MRHPASGTSLPPGVGAISSVGNYEPTSLTFGTDGAVWFTDAKNNSIVRVTTDQLGTTNVDLGTGVTMIAPTVPTPPPATKAVGTLPRVPGVTKVKRGRLAVRVACPAGAGCEGRVRIELARSGKALARTKSYAVAAGSRTNVKLKLSRKGLRSLKPGRVVKVRIELTRKGSTKVLAKRTIKVRRS